MKSCIIKLADDVENSETLTDNYGKVWVKVEAGLCEQACNELRRLHGEVEALRADAERYRFIRNPVMSARTHGHIMYAVEELAEQSLDDYLDAQMKEQP